MVRRRRPARRHRRRGRVGSLAREGLGLGLAHAGDRDLCIVLPHGAEGHRCADNDATRRRLPFLDAPARLFTYDDDNAVQPVAPLTETEVFEWARTHAPVTHRHDLGERAPWVDRLVAWADDEDDLVDAHRLSYLSWHCEGRMVLKIQRSGTTVAVSAGVHHTADPPRPRRPSS